MSIPGRRRAVLATELGLFGLLVVWLVTPVLGGDTLALLRGAGVLAGCLGDGTLSRCGYTPEGTGDGYVTTIGPWPVLQYPLALAARAVTSSVEEQTNLLALASVVAFLAALGASWHVLRRSGTPEWLWLLLPVVLTGPLLGYVSASWGEMLAACLLVLLVAATLGRAHPVLVGVAACGAALTKETSYPFVAALGLLGLWLAARRTGRPVRAHVLGGAVGLAAALVVASLFNVLRFGSVLNENQRLPEYRVPSPGQWLESAAGLVVAPNGGLLVFWPTAFVLLAVLCGVPLWRALRGRAPLADAVPALVIVALLLCLHAGLAAWWSPFGWFAWGPRLTLPWIWPLLLLALAASGELLRRPLVRLLASTWRLAAAVVVLVLLALPHVGFLVATGTLIDFFHADTAACGGPTPAGTPAYYDCLHEQMWLRHPILLDALHGLGTFSGVVTVAAVAAALTGSLLLLRDGLAAPGRAFEAAAGRPAAAPLRPDLHSS